MSTTYAEMSIDELAAALEKVPVEAFKYSFEWDDLNVTLQRRRAARDAILDMAEALDEEGMVVVPREPTPTMITHGLEAYQIDHEFYWQSVAGAYRAMVATSSHRGETP